MKRGAAALLLVLALAACQSTSAPPPAADARAATYGDWTIRQGGYVRVEGGVVK